MSGFTKKERICLFLMLIFVFLFLCYYTFDLGLPADLDEETAALYDLAYTRLLAGAIFLCLVLYLGYPLFSLRRMKHGKAWIPVLAAMLIAINNFPIRSLFCGDMQIDAHPLRIVLFAGACIGIGLFEEIAFRGIVFPTLYEKLLPILKKHREGTEKPHKIPIETTAAVLSILATSAVFGLIHVLNLLSGGSPIAVLMQIGYSFLIGGMCAIVLLYTRSLLFPILIHAVYDFGGLMDAYIASGTRWDTLTVVLTAVIAVAVSVLFLILLLRMKPQELVSMTGKNPDAQSPQQSDKCGNQDADF